METSVDSKVQFSIVIPMYDEEENVIPLTQSIHDSLSSVTYEIIYVDDFSRDQTRNVIKSMQDPKVHLIELKKNYGQSMALAAGIDYAKGELIVTMDGDLQNDPSDILHMAEKLKNEDWDVVTGVRKKRQDNFIRTMPSKIANGIIRKATKLDLKDQGCALKVFTKETAKELNLYGEMHRFINLLAYLNGARITQVDVKHHSRQFGVSKYGLGRTTKVINDLLLILFQRKYFQKPIYLFGNIGLLMFGLGTLINLYMFGLKMLGFDIWGRPLLILGLLLIVVGIQFFSLGIVCDLLMRTYFESQNMRPYRIRKIHTFE